MARPLPTGANASNTVPQTQGYSVKIILNGKQVADLSVDDINRLPSREVNAEGHDDQGPTMLSVLRSAGIQDFNEVKIVGVDRGRMANAELTMQKTQITDNTIIVVNGRGTTKLTSADVPFDSWVWDITDLQVK